MIVCPVCEHQQVQGLECEVCGKQLASAAAASVAVEALPDLELTALRSGPELPTQAVEGLEATRFDVGPDLPGVRLVDVEPTAAAPIGPVAVEAVGDIELGRYVDSGPRTVVGARTCRYCQNVQPEGLTCNRCGMKLPAIVAAAAEVATPVRRGEQVVVKCLQCGSRAVAGEICGGCGVKA